MTDFVNEVLGGLRRNPQMTALGPVLESFKYVERFLQNMYVLEFECAHGSQIDSLFGMFVEITNQQNTNKSRCTIYLTPTESEGVPTFASRTKKVRAFNEYLCTANITTQIVTHETNPDSGTDIWESTVTPIDDVHALKETITATSYATLTSHEWDEQLNVYVTSNTELTQTTGSPSVTVVAGNVTHITYKQLKCGWYLKSTDSFPVITARTYTTTVDFYWPGVLTGFDTRLFDHKDNQVEAFNEPVFLREAYKGPCKATIVETWTLLAPTVSAPFVMQPLPISMSTPFADLNIGPTLHVAMTFNISINSDNPRYESGVQTYNWAATTPTDWPATVLASDTVEPSRGGYWRTVVTINKPA